MLSESHDKTPRMPYTGVRRQFSRTISSGPEMSRLHRIPDIVKTMKTDPRRFPRAFFLPPRPFSHPPVWYPHRTRSVRDSFVRVIRVSSVAFLIGIHRLADSERIPSLSPDSFLHHPGITRLLLPRPCLVPVIGDRWGIDARVKRAGSSPALLAARKTHGGGYRIGVAGNRPCPRVASGAKRPPRVLNQRRCTNGDQYPTSTIAGRFSDVSRQTRRTSILDAIGILVFFFFFFFFLSDRVQSRLNPVRIWDEFVERDGKNTEPN